MLCLSLQGYGKCIETFILESQKVSTRKVWCLALTFVFCTFLCFSVRIFSFKLWASVNSFTVPCLQLVLSALHQVHMRNILRHMTDLVKRWHWCNNDVYSKVCIVLYFVIKQFCMHRHKNRHMCTYTHAFTSCTCARVHMQALII